MQRVPFNDGWSFRPKSNRFGEIMRQGVEPTPVTLPHDALIGTDRTPGGNAATAYFPSGVWEYQRTLDVGADEAGRTVVLELEGVYRDAIVKVNGVRAAHWPYGYSLVTVPIDHLLRPGESNEITVECRTGDDSRWYTGAGIHRPVWLLTGGPLHLEPGGLDVRTPEIDDGGAVVTVSADVRNRTPSTSTPTVRCEVVGADGRVVASAEAPLTAFPGRTTTSRQRLFIADPQRWSPDHPALHTCRVTVLDGDEVVDEDETTFGIRTLSVDPKRGLRINGEPVLLRGACVHHDNGPIGAATIDRAEERRVELLKAAGFNAIRSAHNPMSRAMLDACDRLGVLVMDETFDMWAEPKSEHDYALRFADSWRADVESMVRKDRNHPSVVLYSVGNEIPDGSSAEGLQIARALADVVRALDDTRLVTQAVSGFLVAGPGIFEDLAKASEALAADEGSGINTTLTNLGALMDRAMTSAIITEKTTEAFAHLDVAGYNYMHLRFGMDGEHFPDRVIVSTESFPSLALDDEWQAVLDHDHVIGEFTWTGWDYLGEAGIGRVEYGEAPGGLGMSAFHGEHPWLLAWCGDIDITGRRRAQSFYREIVLGLRREPFVAVHPPATYGQTVAHSSPWSFEDVVDSWSWGGHEGAPVHVDVYADADEVELLLDGSSLGRSKVGRGPRYVTRFETTYQPGRLEAVAWRAGEEVGRAALASPSGEVRLDARAERSTIRGEPTDLAYVPLTLVDDAGSVWTSVERLVQVEVDGPAVLQGLASANPVSDEPFTSDRCTTFGGRALAVVRPTGPGTVTVTATVDGCPPQRVEIEAT